MSELGSVVETLRSEALADLPDARIEEDFLELHRAIQQLDAERLRRLAEVDRRKLFERDGFLSAASWLVSTCKEAWGAARSQVRIARGLSAMPVTRAALESGAVSISAVRTLVEAHAADQEAFSRSEPALVDAAARRSVADLGRVTALWRERIAQAEHGGELVRSRRLHASMTFLGMVRIDGDLDPVAGESLLTALDAVMDAETRAADVEPRTPAQRRADALAEICRSWLARSDRPTVAGERPHVTVTVDVSDLPARRCDATSTGSGLGVLDRVGPIDVQAARTLACDASVMRLVMRGRSEPLDVGRRTPVVPVGLRRAVIARDRRCRFPGCDRPHTWCDAHHIVHWADGGATSLANLLLLCRRHHGLVHRGGFSLERRDGRAVVRRSDGSIVEDRAPP